VNQLLRQTGNAVLLASSLGLLILLSPSLYGADAKTTAVELQAIVDELNDLDNWFSTVTDKRKRLERDVRNKDKEVAAVGTRVRQAQAQLTQTQRELTELGYRRKLLIEQKEVQAQRIGEHLAAAYRLSGQDIIKQLLNQESPAELERMMRYHEYLSSARIKALEQFEQTVRDLEQNRIKLEQQTATLTQQQQQLNQRQAQLVSERDQRKTLVAALNEEAEDKTARQKRLQANRGRLEQLLVELRTRAPELDGEAFAKRKGQLPWPITGRINNRFGSSRDDGKMKWHGVMFRATEGDPVSAVYRGKVVFADWLRGYGLLIIVDHGGDYMTLYGNADGLLKNLDDWVESGELIAQAGRSGGQTSSGLYFEIRHKGKVSDPLAWLVKN